MASWRDNLRPGSFRGVPFKGREMGAEGGRRLALFEYAQKDNGYNEDEGRARETYSLDVYVIGDDYMAQRDRLLTALRAFGVGTLVHPTMGEIQVNAKRWRLRETSDEGRMARLDIEFVEGGALPSPRASIDTASVVSSAVGVTYMQTGADFTAGYGVVRTPPFIQQAAAALWDDVSGTLGALVGTASGIPGVSADDMQTLTAAIGVVAAFAIDPAGATAGALQAVFGAFASTVANALSLGVSVTVGITQTSSRGPARVADRSYGLIALSTFGSALRPIAPVTPSRARQAANQTAIVSLVQGAAIGAAAQVYASTSFVSAEDAEAARDQITAAIDAQSLAASSAATAQAWDALYTASVQDLTARGKQLPNVIAYKLNGSLPSLALAQRIYRDPTRADELVARNAVVHPLFMPVTGEALSE